MRNNKKYHDRIAGKYDRIYDTEYWRFYRDLSWRHLRAFLPAARPARAADLGCGTGWFGLRLLRAGCDCVFVDPSIGMLEQARAAVQDDAEARQVTAEFVQQGLEDLSELADASLDFATGQGDPLSFCESPERALRELARVLKPGAALVLSVDNRCAGVRTLIDEGQGDAALALLRTGRTEWRSHKSDERFGMKMFLAEELDTLLDKSGFTVESRIGKTCLLQRRHEELLAEPEARRRWLAAEESVHKQPGWWALASHLQVAARRR
ncbi:MAG: class I SAM-dependent methyltransferase [Planctomycetota bacterium]